MLSFDMSVTWIKFHPRLHYFVLPLMTFYEVHNNVEVSLLHNLLKTLNVFQHLNHQ